MNSDLSRHDSPTASEVSQSKLFVPFILILLCAVAVGFGIRYYRNKLKPTTEVGWEVYFSEVDTVDSPYSLEERLVDRLGDAQERVDAALYDLDAKPVADALIAAYHRGVQVRIVTEADNIDTSEIGRLQEVGIPVTGDSDNDGLMHHKFIVIDERYVWTGSYNITHNGAYRNNNNVILVDSVQLAYNFTQEFRELFFAETQVGKPSGVFVAYPKVRLNDGTEIFTYFSPEGDTISSLVKEIQSAEQSIHFMAFSFTHDALGDAMRDRFKSGIDVRGVFEERQVDEHSEYGAMREAGLLVIIDKSRGVMHHKVIVIDGETVITGSYNFSKNAEKRNNENLLIIKRNRELAAAYLAEFARITRWGR